MPMRRIYVEPTAEGWRVRLEGKCCWVEAPTREAALAKLVERFAPSLGVEVVTGAPEPSAA